MDDEGELLWRLYSDDREFARHHETQRTNASGVVIAISAGLIAFISSDQKLTLTDVPASVLLIGLGVFGIVFTQKHYERSRLHLYRAYEYYFALEQKFPNLNMEKLRERANNTCATRFGAINRLKLSYLWMMLHGIIVLIGIILLLICSTSG